MTGPERRSLRIVVTGFRPSIRDLCDDLARQPGIELIGAAGRVAEAAWAFNAHGIDVVLHGMVSGPLPIGDLTEIRQYTGAPIILLAEQASPSLFEDAFVAEVADVVALPQPAEHVAFAVRKAGRVAASYAGAQRARIITSFSPKGGTGKSVVATNVAATLAKQEGVRALLLDLDLQFGDAAIMLGIDPQRTLLDLVTAPGELDGEKFGGYVVKHGSSGLELLPAPLRPEEGELVTEQKIERLLDVAGSAYDAVVVDTSPSFHGPMLSALDRSDVLLLICTPEVPTLKNVRLGLETLRKLSFPEDRVRIVLNRANADGGIGRAQVESVLAMPVSYELPSSPDVPVAVNEGTPVSLSSPSSPFSIAVHELASSLIGLKPAGDSSEDGHPGLRGAMKGLAAAWLHSRGEKGTASAPETSA
jgi:pilus assembly protein CpaE